MELCVKSLEGTFTLAEIRPGSSLLDLKKLVHERLHQGATTQRQFSQQRLIHKDRVLSNGTLSEAGVSSGDSVVVIYSKEASQLSSQAEAGQVPDAAMIRDAIREEADRRGLPASTIEGSIPLSRRTARVAGDGLGLPTELDMDHRLLQLIEALEGRLSVLRTVGQRQGADNFSPRNQPMSARSLTPQTPQAPVPITPPQPSAEAIAQIQEMGFTEALARKALILMRGDVAGALDWLLQHGEEPGAEEPPTQEELRQVYGGGLSGRGSGPASPETAAAQLVEMGFEREDVVLALRRFPDIDVALAWLLNQQELREAAGPPPQQPAAAAAGGRAAAQNLASSTGVEALAGGAAASASVRSNGGIPTSLRTSPYADRVPIARFDDDDDDDDDEDEDGNREGNVNIYAGAREGPGGVQAYPLRGLDEALGGGGGGGSGAESMLMRLMEGSPGLMQMLGGAAIPGAIGTVPLPPAAPPADDSSTHSDD